MGRSRCKRHPWPECALFHLGHPLRVTAAFSRVQNTFVAFSLPLAFSILLSLLVVSLGANRRPVCSFQRLPPQLLSPPRV